MLLKFKIFILIIMLTFLGSNVNAKYEKLAYDFEFKDLDGSSLHLSIIKTSQI